MLVRMGVSRVQYGPCFSRISHLNDTFLDILKIYNNLVQVFFPFALATKVTFPFFCILHLFIANRSD